MKADRSILSSRTTWLGVGAFVLFGLAIRIASAQGALWLDEAWSAVFARDAATPLGVVLNINHDNNHYLNTLWLQVVGFDAPPMLQRALSIAAGTATIAVAAIVAGRRSPVAALLVAALFALSPVMVLYGSEARGYAPMLLALMIAIAIVDRWLHAPDTAPPATALALAFGLGLFAQATMLFGLAIMAAWTGTMLLRHKPPLAASALLIRLYAPAAIVMALLVATAAWAAAAAPGGFHLGNREAHDWSRWIAGLVLIVDHAVMLPALLLLGITAGRRRDGPLAILGAWAVIAFPLAVALLALPNSGMPRYYLVAVPPLLLLAGTIAADAVAVPGWRRWIAAAALALFAMTALARDIRLMTERRGDPGIAIAALRDAAPAGAVVAIDRTRSAAVLEAAAAAARYRLIATSADCPAARWLFVERDGTERFPEPATRCGRTYAPVARSSAPGLSGSHWRLYRQAR